MEATHRFSFILPIYNVEGYLEECIKSILAQDFTEYEIILVDDGSTDSSGSLCDEYAEKYENIRVIHQVNGGLSEARNTGIRNATGEYILFVDSDDYIASGAVSKINQVIEQNDKPDVVFLEAVKVYPDEKTEPMGDGYIAEKICKKNRDEVLRFITTMPKFPGSAWSKAVKRSLFDEFLYFTKGLISEDIDWSYRLFGKAERFAYLPEKYYYYRQARPGSITSSVSAKKIESLFWIVERWMMKKPTDTYREYVNSYVAYQYMILLMNLALMDKDEAHPYWERAKALKWILKYGKSRKLKLVRFVSGIIGIKLTARLLKIYKGF